MNKNKINEYYNIVDLLDQFPASQYYIVLGQRSNGKSYSSFKYGIDQYFKTGSQFGVIRRSDDDLTNKQAKSMLSFLDKYILERYNKYLKFWNKSWILLDNPTDKISTGDICGHALALNLVENLKGNQFDYIDTIIFDEFMSARDRYLPNEVNLLIQMVSTVFRNRLNGKVLMIGNTISKTAPYFRALNVLVHRFEKGEIRELEFNANGRVTKFVIQRCPQCNVLGESENGELIAFNNFGNSSVGQMVTTGDFETQDYNRVRYNIMLDLPSNKERDQLNIDLKTKIITPKTTDKTTFKIQYLDSFYSIYLVKARDKKKIVACFRRFTEAPQCKKGVIYLINGNVNIDNIINVRNLNYDLNLHEATAKQLRQICACLANNDTIFHNNDCGEDVYTAFANAGLDINE